MTSSSWSSTARKTWFELRFPARPANLNLRWSPLLIASDPRRTSALAARARRRRDSPKLAGLISTISRPDEYPALSNSRRGPVEAPCEWSGREFVETTCLSSHRRSSRPLRPDHLGRLRNGVDRRACPVVQGRPSRSDRFKNPRAELAPPVASRHGWSQLLHDGKSSPPQAPALLNQSNPMQFIGTATTERGPPDPTM